MLAGDELGGEVEQSCAAGGVQSGGERDVATDDGVDRGGGEAGGAGSAGSAAEADVADGTGGCCADTVGGMSNPSATPPSAAEMWEQRYGAAEYVYGTEPNEFLAECVGSIAPGRALCLADGEGRNAVFLARQGFEVHSVDLSSAGVAKSQRLAAEHGVQVHAVQGDLSVYDIGVGQWDLVVSVFAHMPPPVRVDLHRRVVASLAPGGTLVLEAYTPAQIGRGTGGPPVAEMTMTLAGLRDELAGLTFVHAVELERQVVEGSGHTGLGAVVQLLATTPT